jgi:hypothetical protein
LILNIERESEIGAKLKECSWKWVSKRNGYVVSLDSKVSVECGYRVLSDYLTDRINEKKEKQKAEKNAKELEGRVRLIVSRVPGLEMIRANEKTGYVVWHSEFSKEKYRLLQEGGGVWNRDTSTWHFSVYQVDDLIGLLEQIEFI